MRTHKQDSPFLFIDHLHSSKVPVAETITTFFVRRCVYFAFLGEASTFYPIDQHSDMATSPGGMTSDTYIQWLAAPGEAPTDSGCALTRSSLSTGLSDVDMQDRSCMELASVEAVSSMLQPAKSQSMGFETADHHLKSCSEHEVVMVDSEPTSVDPAADHEESLYHELLEQQLVDLRIPKSLEQQLQLACLQDH
jgi:hypothetical protein